MGKFGTEFESENQQLVIIEVHEVSAVLEVQGQENRQISLLLLSHKQSAFPWGLAEEYLDK